MAQLPALQKHLNNNNAPVRDFDWSRDRKLQIMIKLNGAVLVDPRTPVFSGVGAKLSNQQHKRTLSTGTTNSNSAQLSPSGAATPQQQSAGLFGGAVKTPPTATLDPASSDKFETSSVFSAVSNTSRSNKNNNTNLTNLSLEQDLKHYCFYIKWKQGSWQSGKFAPLSLEAAHTRDDGRIEFVFPPSDTNYEISFPVDLGTASTPETKKLSLYCYILTFKNPMDPFLSAEKRMKFFRTEMDAGRVLRQTVIDNYTATVNRWLNNAKPMKRRQVRLDFSSFDTLVLDYAILREDDLAPYSIQLLPFDGSGSSGAATAGKKTTSPTSNNNNNKNDDGTTPTTTSPTSRGKVKFQDPSSSGGATKNDNQSAEDDTVYSDPDLRPGLAVQGRVDIFRALSTCLNKAATAAKLPVSLTGLVSIFETGNCQILKLPGLSTAAAFSILLSNDSPFLSTFHEKRKDKGYMPSPWKENLKEGAPKDPSMRMRYSGYEMRFGGHYVEIREHSFALGYRLPSESGCNYVGQFHLQPTGMASAARVELAIHIGNGLLNSITSESGIEAPPTRDDGSPVPCCTVHFAMAVTFSNASIEGRFRSKADSMIPKMLNALSTTARALLGADDLSRQADDAAAAAAGKAFLRRNDARVSMNPLVALRPYSMKSNACIAQHFLKMALDSPTPMRPRPANLDLIATILTMHLKHESIVRLAMEILDRCIGRHGRGVAAYCPGLSDAVERARALYKLPPVEGGVTSLDHTIEQLLDRQVYEDIRNVGVWRVLEGKSRISQVAGSESSFFMGDIHRVRVALPAIRELFESKNAGGGGGGLLSRGSKIEINLTPDQVNILVALLSLHLNDDLVVDTVTFALDRTASHCLVSSLSLFFIVDSVYSLYPKYRPRLDMIKNAFAKFHKVIKGAPGKDATSKFGAAFHDGDPVFQAKITLYEPIDEGDCQLVLTKKSFYLGSIAFPLEHLYTIARTRVYWFFPAIRIVSQKPRQTVTTGKRDFSPLLDDLGQGDDDDDELSLLEQNKYLDTAFRDLDLSVAANFDVGLGDGGEDDQPRKLLVDDDDDNNPGVHDPMGDEELSSTKNQFEDVSAPFMTRSTQEPRQDGPLNDRMPAHHKAATTSAAAASSSSKQNQQQKTETREEVAVTFLAKCWDIDELFEALKSIGYSGRITTD